MSSAPLELAEGRLRLDRPAPGVARLTLDSPAKRNALDHAILEVIATTLPTLREVRCLVLTAVGPVFSAGYDLGALPNSPQLVERAHALVAQPLAAAVAALRAFPLPTVAALNGHAIGGGLELALACDLRIAARSAELGMPPVKLGLVYSHTGIRAFLDAVGAARTRELFLLGRRISASTAAEWGLVSELVERDGLAEASVAYAAEVAGGAPLALAGNKAVIETLLAAEGALAPSQERELEQRREACFASEDFREGLRAFAERRTPVWRGR